ncbi:hypothetical protein ACLOJK_037707 [Asimina triloba]
MQAVAPKHTVGSGLSSQISVGSRPSGQPATLVPFVVPQARIASLARFLEKPKERVVNNGPYSLPTSSTENACGSNISSFVNKPQTSPVTQSSSNDQQFCRALHENDTMNLQANFGSSLIWQYSTTRLQRLMKERRVQTVDHHSPTEQGQKQRTREIEVIHQHHPTSEAAGGGVVAGAAEAMANTIQSVIDALTGTSSSEERKNETLTQNMQISMRTQCAASSFSLHGQKEETQSILCQIAWFPYRFLVFPFLHSFFCLR